MEAYNFIKCSFFFFLRFSNNTGKIEQVQRNANFLWNDFEIFTIITISNETIRPESQCGLWSNEFLRESRRKENNNIKINNRRQSGERPPPPPAYFWVVQNVRSRGV